MSGVENLQAFAILHLSLYDGAESENLRERNITGATLGK